MAMLLPGTLWDAVLGSVAIFEMAMLLPVGDIAGVKRILLLNGDVTAWHSVGYIAGVRRNLLSKGDVTAWSSGGNSVEV